jgi:hypothetical protein
MLCHPQHMNPAGGHLNHEQDVETLQEHGVHGEEVHRQHTGGLGTQELPPRYSRPLGRRSNAGAPQDGPHGAGPDTVAEPAQLAVDTTIAPGRVLPGQPQHQRAELGCHAGTAMPVSVGPAAPDQVAMPAQQRSGAGRPGPARLGGAAAAPAQPAPPSRLSRPVAGPSGVAVLRLRGATRAARRPWPPHPVTAAQATPSPSRTTDGAVEQPCAEHRGQMASLANLQLSTHDRPSGAHRLPGRAR